MIEQFREGQFVRYKTKNELAVVKGIASLSVNPLTGREPIQTALWIWSHLGGTASRCPVELLEPLSTYSAFKENFSNAYARSSLIERALRVDEKADTSVLIDGPDVRVAVKEALRSVSISRKKEGI